MSERLQRILRLTSEVVAGEGRKNAGELAKKLGISRRTLFRDIASLRSAGVSLRVDRATGEYTVEGNASPVQLFPTRSDLVELLLQVALGSPPQKAQAAKRAVSAARCLARTLPRPQRTLFEQLFQRREREVFEAGDSLVANHIDTAMNALLAGKTVSVHTQSAGAMQLKVSGLLKDSERWLLQGHPPDDNSSVEVDLSSVDYLYST